MRLFYLVRHGAFDNTKRIHAGRLPLSLSEEGIQQAHKLRAYFKGKDIARIYSSPVKRARQTAEIIADSILPVYYDLRLAETFSAYQGMWYDGKINVEDVYAHKKELGGEGFQDLQTRTMSFFNEVIKDGIGNMIIVSHADPLWCLYLGIQNRPLTDELKEPGEFGNPEYLPKGAIRPFRVEEGLFVPLEMITQESL